MMALGPALGALGAAVAYYIIKAIVYRTNSKGVEFTLSNSAISVDSNKGVLGFKKDFNGTVVMFSALAPEHVMKALASHEKLEEKDLIKFHRILYRLFIFFTWLVTFFMAIAMLGMRGY